MTHYDLAIVGSGIAGLTGAIYAARAGLKVNVIEGYYIDANEYPGGQVATTPLIENYPGFAPEHGANLIDIARQQALDSGVTFTEDKRVRKINYTTQPHVLHLEEYGTPSTTLSANRVLLATGASARELGISGEQEFMGKGVSSCATCDGAFYAGQDVVLVGGGDVAVEDALYLANIVNSLTLLIRANTFTSTQVKAIEQLTNNAKINILFNTTLKSIDGNDSVTNVVIQENGTERTLENITGVFIAIGRDPQSQLANCTTNEIILPIEDGYLVATDGGRTNIPTVYVAGDVMDREYKQAIIAAGSGAKAGMNITRDYLAEQ